jgi:succinate dehydrogenase/fumarate reductase flavoprotein subunit
VSRRQFVAGTVGGLVVGAVVGAAAGSVGFPKTNTTTETSTQVQTTTLPVVTSTTTSVSQPWLPASWDDAADVVVVGFGGAGGVAAMYAAKAGVKVILLEKAPQQYVGGNTSVSGGNIFTPSPPADAITYLNAMAGPYPIPQDMVSTWAQAMSQNLQTLQNIGCSPFQEDTTAELPPPVNGVSYLTAPSSFLPEFSALPGSDAAHEIGDGAPPGRGYDYFQDLLAQVNKASGITVMYQTPATGLIQNGQTGEILGVQATSNGKTINIKASRAVILTLGGYENNQQMLRDYCQLSSGGPRGTPYNTGDGIPMVTKVGAALWHMDNISGSGYGMQPDPTQPFFALSAPASGYIFIGADGARFVNETISAHHGKIPFNYVANPTVTASTTWIPYPAPFPVQIIFDSTTCQAGPMSALPNATPSASGFGWNVVHGLYTWSKDNSVEIAKGWIQQGATLQALAPLINRDPTLLSSVVAKYNSYCAAGVDADFGRSKTSLVPVVNPPFYAMNLVYLMFNTQGGAKRNTSAQVVDANNNPIPKLYSAGEFGSIYSWEYNGGGNLGETVAFGAIAGQNAAKETPWG